MKWGKKGNMARQLWSAIRGLQGGRRVGGGLLLFKKKKGPRSRRALRIEKGAFRTGKKTIGFRWKGIVLWAKGAILGGRNHRWHVWEREVRRASQFLGKEMMSQAP